MTAARSSSPEVRNPVLALPSVARFVAEASPEAVAFQLAFLAELRADCHARGDKSWSQRKYSSAAYWKVCAVYAGHQANALRRMLAR